MYVAQSLVRTPTAVPSTSLNSIWHHRSLSGCRSEPSDSLRGHLSSGCPVTFSLCVLAYVPFLLVLLLAAELTSTSS